MKKIALLVLDSVGVGHAADADKYNDNGANTLGNITKWCHEKSRPLKIPHLVSWGLGSIVQEIETAPQQSAFTARLAETSAGKDTTTGHWEIAGTPLDNAFATFPNGFDPEWLDSWCKENKLEGYLGNCVASGTQIIEQLGEEHLKSNKPIVYTSADSVFQIACHEESFGLERLYELCRSARAQMDEKRVGRVIARPFTGTCAGDFKRSENRRDFSFPPPKPNLLDLFIDAKREVSAVGKIEDIFAQRSISYVDHTGNNDTTLDSTIALLKKQKDCGHFIFSNLIDFDQHYGHRRDPEGYAACIEAFDARIPELIDAADDETLILITADHGNDPTYKGSDHTREQVPLLCWSKKFNSGRHLGDFSGFDHIAKLCLEAQSISSKALKRDHQLKSLWSLIHES